MLLIPLAHWLRNKIRHFTSISPLFIVLLLGLSMLYQQWAINRLINHCLFAPSLLVSGDPICERSDPCEDVWSSFGARYSPRDDTAHLTRGRVNQGPTWITFARSLALSIERTDVLTEADRRRELHKVSQDTLGIGDCFQFGALQLLRDVSWELKRRG